MEMLIPILVADVLNPVLLAFLIYAAGGRHGAIDSCAGLLGHTVAYFCAGLALLWGFDRIANALNEPRISPRLLVIVHAMSYTLPSSPTVSVSITIKIF